MECDAIKQQTWSEADYVNNRLDPQIAYHSNRAVEYKQKYEFIQVSVIVLSALVPVCALISNKPFIPYIVAVIGSLQLILTSICRLKKYHELWIAYRGIAEALNKEYALFCTNAEKYASSDTPLQLLAEVVENAIQETTGTWSTVAGRRDDPPQTSEVSG